MIKNSKQIWEVGHIVRIGFMRLMVLEKEKTPGDGLPDAYILRSTKGKMYRFVPHNGLSRMKEYDDPDTTNQEAA